MHKIRDSRTMLIPYKSKINDQVERFADASRQ